MYLSRAKGPTLPSAPASTALRFTSLQHNMTQISNSVLPALPEQLRRDQDPSVCSALASMRPLGCAY